jgi:hypothetical protein
VTRALLVLVACLLLGSLPATAQEAAPDVHPSADLRLPPLPDGFTAETVGSVRWAYPEPAQGVARDLQVAFRGAWERVTAELGGVDNQSLLIRIGRNPEELRALAPREAPPPAYATGVAYPAVGLILLSLSVPDTWERPNMETVLVHELSHVALHRAVGGQPVPRWFSEGVAVQQAGEQNLERIQTLWTATVGGRLLGLEDLNRGFPSRPHQVSVAYAQSADFVRWFQSRRDGEAQFLLLISRLQQGDRLERALELTSGRTVAMLEDEWRESLSSRFQALPLLLGGGGLWILGAVLLVFAYRRRRREHREKTAAWAEEEALADELARQRRLRIAFEAKQAAARDAGDDGVLFVLPQKPRDSSVPTVQHDGRDHTLH